MRTDPTPRREINLGTSILIIDLDEIHPEPTERCTVAEYVEGNDLDEASVEELLIALDEKGYADVGGGAAPPYRVEVEACAFEATDGNDSAIQTEPDLQPAPTDPTCGLDRVSPQSAGGTLAQAVPPVPFAPHQVDAAAAAVEGE